MNPKLDKAERFGLAQQCLEEDLLLSSKKTVLLLHQIDTMLLQIDHILNVSQPPLTGKIRIEWPMRNSTRYTPVPVVWTRLKGNEVRFRYKMVPTANLPRRAKHAGPFAKHAKWVRALLMQVQWLLDMRNRALIAHRDYQLTISKLAEGNEHNFGQIRTLITEVFGTLELDPATWHVHSSGDPRGPESEDQLVDE
ncbi:hypothetical protein RY831_30420 [Noviherbaspirillum sp. CPCC 100848]|uniref:Uncharacterized protein n=2 Tax=Noviherbaspirillum album TaxID=3080276 RepID=A0ABU6JJK5_9BURK|nr:hypothetical protein [Noviherbaspirillum sp. CPCC 100848]